MAKAEKPLSELTYEQAFTELEAVVEAMESEQQPLDEALKLFERGQALAQHCSSLLENAELRIRELNTSKTSLKED